MEVEINATPATINPFFSIWVRPKRTIRWIVENQPEKYVMGLAGISGAYTTLENAGDRGIGDDWSLLAILVAAFLVGPIAGVIVLHVSGALFRWSGRLFGGVADSRQVRAALAWSALPEALLLAIYLVVILIWGRDWFVSDFDMESQSLLLTTLFVLTAIVIGIWRTVLSVLTMAEVHRFSIWRSIATYVVGTLAFAIPALILFFVCAQLTG